MLSFQMAGVVLLFAVLFYADLTATASMKKDLSQANVTKSVDLVSVLQEDLRKNNDDYKDIREPTRDAANTQLRNPYLGNEDTVNSEPESKGEKNINFARRSYDDKQKTHDKNRTITTNDTKPHDKHMLHDKDASKDNKIKHYKNIKTDNEKIKSDEKFLKTHRKNIPSNNKESMVHDVKDKIDERNAKLAEKTRKPNAEEKVGDKNAMLHDKNIKPDDKLLKSRVKVTKNMAKNDMESRAQIKWDKTRQSLQKTKTDDERTKSLARKSINRKEIHIDRESKVSREEEVFDMKNETTMRNQKNDSRRSFNIIIKKGFSTINSTARKNMKLDQLHKMLDKEGLLTKFLKGKPAKAETRNRAFEVESDREPPPADTVPSAELDMLPATGERIDTLKRKGRFCFRHVLFPEGPKYDSRGRVYEPAHAAKLGHRNFAHTRKPKQILPKCCNCCKKSVLGCE